MGPVSSALHEYQSTGMGYGRQQGVVQIILNLPGPWEYLRCILGGYVASFQEPGAPTYAS